MSFLDMLLLTDPVYAALYADVTDKIEEIDRAVNSTLSSLNQRIADQEQRLNLLKDRAFKLQDGTRVYQSDDGSVYAENGAVLSHRQAAGILWMGHHPRWEEYKENQERLDQLSERREEIEAYRDGTLQQAKDQMSDPENPPDKDELRDILQKLDDELPSELHAHMNAEENIPSHSGFMAHFGEKMDDRVVAESQDQPDLQPIKEAPLSLPTNKPF
ncbi:MAG: hypothetical protein KDI61_09100 [Alphaproteobacteria bacterium]|nr:hypothetical protein [Alphaproteobacteria bacterium]